jgi:hypothetical protein
VRVAPGQVGLDRGGADPAVRADIGEVVADLEDAVELAELAAGTPVVERLPVTGFESVSFAGHRCLSLSIC